MSYPEGSYGEGYGSGYGTTVPDPTAPALGQGDFDVFFSDFAVPCSRAGGYTFGGILDVVEMLEGSGPGEVITRVPTLLYPIGQAGRLTIGETVTVNGTTYVVRAHELQDDGSLARAALRVP